MPKATPTLAQLDNRPAGLHQGRQKVKNAYVIATPRLRSYGRRFSHRGLPAAIIWH
jgi:hypothetical protein